MVDVDGNVAPRLDTRILNKIPLLQGRDTAEFRSWQFVLKASLGLVDTAYSTDLPHVEALRSPMTQPENVDTKARSEKLYFILALTTADHAQVIVQQVESGHGYEPHHVTSSWFRRYSCQTLDRFKDVNTILRQIRPTHGSTPKQRCLLSFEK